MRAAVREWEAVSEPRPGPRVGGFVWTVTRWGAAGRGRPRLPGRAISRATRQHARMKVLLVCLGNICRSPTAEGVVRAIAAREFPALDIEVDSAGTADYHVGEPPDRRTVAAARRRGYELAGLRARQVQPADFA